MKSIIRWLVLAAVLGIYLVMLLRNTCYFAAGPDSSGYMNEARLLASGRVRLVLEPLRMFNLDAASMIYAFTPLGFGIGGHGTIVPIYPAGAPLHFVVAAAIGGWETAPFVVGPLAAVGCLILMYFVGRELGLPPILRIAAMAILGAAPFLIEHAVQPVSDILATFWALATILCALRSVLGPRSSVLGWPVAAGIALGIGVWVRPSNILIALPLAVAMRFRFSRLAMAAATALPFGIALIWFNRLLYGSALESGYGTILRINSLHIAQKCFPAHAFWLAKMMTPLIMPIGLLVMFDRRIDRWQRALLVSWFGVFIAFYSTYDVCGDWMSERFLLPGLPGLIFGTLQLAQSIVQRFRVTYARAAVALLIVAIVANEIDYCTRRFQVLLTDESDSIYPESVHWAEKHLPGNALVFSGLLSGAFYYYSHRFTGRYDQMNPERTKTVAESAAGTLPWYAVVSVVETDGQQLAKHMPGRWTEVGTYKSIKMWRFEPR